MKLCLLPLCDLNKPSPFYDISFITISGQTILKSNLYSLEAGEPSVWDKELSGVASPTGQSSSGEMKYQDYVPGNTSRRKTKSSSSAKASPGKKTKALSAIEQAAAERKLKRSTHNSEIKRDKLNAQQRRIRFIKSNWEHIKKFVHSKPPTDQEVAKLTNVPSYPRLTKQPACLSNVTMRDYQLAGINWLINAYESGISVILGDEM